MLTEDEDVIDAVKDELWDATLIPEAEPEADVPPCDVAVAVMLSPLPVDVGFIIHVDVCDAPADKLGMVLHAVTTENHEGLLESSVTMLVSVELPAVLLTVIVAVACSFSVNDFAISAVTVNAAKARLDMESNDIKIDDMMILWLMSSPRIPSIC